ncbi:Mechanosensitive channel MscK precursor [Candidatus Brocadiaceae bacterium S225]|uniref:Mechanosensitive channel MscK n=1 Tax=Candidatus Scalindua brodae TaxID=237368 RepID=A0A0B0ELF1_9BACT|nr:MAG: Mechanosensitive channel MscK precursor [Candidatus Scalindua brodae]TWU34008.1 Mechanosensitive channel MscK precursor [Candidatus Brocadiaceae bacterium S225]
MPKTNYRLKECILSFMCLSTLLFNGCTFTMPKPSKSSSSDIEKDKTGSNKPSVINNEIRADETDAKQGIPFTMAGKPQNKPPDMSGKGYLSEWPSMGVEMVDRDGELEVSEKVKNLEARLKEEKNERKKTDILVEELSKKISAFQVAEAVAARPGTGYLSDGSTIALGIVDGDDELRVLKKIKKLEARLEEEENKVKSLNEELADLQTAKEKVENDFANSKKSLQENIDNLLKEINVLESTVKETESRAIAAENELLPIKKELLKVQISETKVQQELYKLKIEKLKKNEE